MTKVGILDDEVIICETLNKYLLELGYNVPDYAMNYNEALNLIAIHKPDIMLLDINIGGNKTGIDVADYIRKNYNMPLIFISSYSDKNTLQSAIETQPNGYLLKPFTKNDLYAAIETALSNFSTNNIPNNSLKLLPEAFFIKQDSMYVKVKFTEIKFIKSEGVYAEIFTINKKILIRETLKNLMDVLPKEKFYQVHRSYIVNLVYIDAVNSEFLLIEKETIPISRNSREEFIKRLNFL